MKTTKEMIEIMKAYDEGKEIQIFDTITHEWVKDMWMYWNWGLNDYRVKPESKYRPMTCQEILNKLEQTGFMLKHLRQNKIISVVEVNIDKDYVVTLSLTQDVADGVNKDLFKNLLTFSKLTPKNLGLNYSFIDGTPISTEDINED